MFALVHDGGCEGFSPPIQLFCTLQEAESAVALAGREFKIFQVPIWPAKALDQWFNLKPVSDNG